MEIIGWITGATLFGALAMYSGMKISEYQKKKEIEQNKRIETISNELNDLKEQLKGKQLPYFVRDGLEDWRAIENANEFDLTRIQLYLQEMTKTVDQAVERKQRAVDIYKSLRNPNNKRKP